MSYDWDFDWGTGTTQTVLYGLGMIALGFWFGNQYTGRLARQEYIQSQTLTDLEPATNPEWFSTVQSTQRIAIIAFGICMIGVIAADYYADRD